MVSIRRRHTGHSFDRETQLIGARAPPRSLATHRHIHQHVHIVERAYCSLRRDAARWSRGAPSTLTPKATGVGVGGRERLVIYCQTSSVSAAHPLRIVLLSAPRVGRSYEQILDGFELHLLPVGMNRYPALDGSRFKTRDYSKVDNPSYELFGGVAETARAAGRARRGSSRCPRPPCQRPPPPPGRSPAT